MPAFRYAGRVVAGFLATSKGCSYFPFSGTTLATVAADVKAHRQTKSALHFDPKHPLSVALVRKLLKARITETEGNGPRSRTHDGRRVARRRLEERREGSPRRRRRREGRRSGNVLADGSDEVRRDARETPERMSSSTMTTRCSSRCSSGPSSARTSARQSAAVRWQWARSLPAIRGPPCPPPHVAQSPEASVAS